MSVTTRSRRGFAAGLSAALVAGALTLTAGAPAQAAAVDNIQFRWGFNHESNNSAFAPGTFNFFSAGKLGNPEEGGQTLPSTGDGSTWANGKAANWKASDGNVRIEKKQADGSYAPATFAGTKTSPSGGSISPPTSANFSDHQVVIDHGTGTIDAATGTADISWDGDFSVVYYSGMSFFYLSDPELTVSADGTGKLTATASGYASSQEDMTVWEPLDDEQVTLATLKNVDVTDSGFSSTPEYLGVEYDAGATGTPQVRSGDTWGSFPQSFVDFASKVGAGPYWYSSGGSVDKNKQTQPLEVRAVDEAAPTATTTSLSTKSSAYGSRGSATVTVKGATAGDVTLSASGKSWTQTVGSGGTATFALPNNWTPGKRTLTATYQGTTTTLASKGTTTHTVTKAKPVIKRIETLRASRSKSGWTKVKITWAGGGGSKPTGTIRAWITRKNRKLVGSAVGVTAKAKFPKATSKGSWVLHLRYYGDSKFARVDDVKPALTMTVK